MKMTLAGVGFTNWLGRAGAHCLLVATLLAGLTASPTRAVSLFPGGTNAYVGPLNSWSFNDTNSWTSDDGDAPLSFTNLSASDLGNGLALVMDNPGGPAWLQVGITNADGTTNLTVAVGSVTLWYAPAWAGTGQGGSGPGQWASLLTIGNYTPDSSAGFWSLYVDAAGQNVLFSAQTNDGSGNFATYATAPVAFTTNYWHFFAWVYSLTNSALYVDGLLATNGPPLTNYPGLSTLASGVYLGSSHSGTNQAAGMLDDVETWATPLSARAIAGAYSFGTLFYYGNFLNRANLQSGPSVPSDLGTYDVISGTGDLGTGVSTASCTDGTGPDDVWLTNVTASASGGTMSLTFSIEGGEPGVPYDVFANSVLFEGATNFWSWMGQGYQCRQYTLGGLPSTGCFLVLGTPLDSTGEGLTDAYEQLVLGLHPSGPQFDSYGVPYAWYAENGLLPLTGSLATQDPDADALLNYQEYQYGTQPQVAEGLSVWVSTPAASSAIP